MALRGDIGETIAPTHAWRNLPLEAHHGQQAQSVKSRPLPGGLRLPYEYDHAKPDYVTAFAHAETPTLAARGRWRYAALAAARAAPPRRGNKNVM